jgi:8-oxo-dGTP pyrophosphatase MutT (NUDIX family)
MGNRSLMRLYIFYTVNILNGLTYDKLLNMIHSDDDKDDAGDMIEYNRYVKCNNCGKMGHTIKQCLNPIKSYGIITYHVDSDQIVWILLVERKYTYAFCDFIKGNFENINELGWLVDEFTDIELLLVFEYYIDDYKQLFTSTIPHQTVLTKTYSRFVEQYTKVLTPNKDKLVLQARKLLKESNRRMKDMMWEIPRGKKNYWEKPINCAMREFSEETGVCKKKLIHRKDINVVCEKIVGTNNLEYEFSYYVMKLKDKENVYINSQLFEQHSEIRNVCWMKYDDVLQLFNHHSSFEKRYNIMIRLKNMMI